MKKSHVYYLITLLSFIFCANRVFCDISDFAAPGGASLSSADYSMTGDYATDYSTYRVDASGDIDGDGLKDVLISAIYNDDGGAGSGKVYLFLGSGLRTMGSLNLADADYSFEGAAGDMAGVGMAFAGDVNGDGLDDILIGAFGNNYIGTDSGMTYLVLSSSLGAPGSTINLSTDADYYFTGDASQDHSGVSVSGAGDVDGDGLDDILIAASNADHGAVAASGEIYLVLASSLGAPGSSFDLGNSDYIFYGEAVGDYLGTIEGGHDADGDGIPDILAGAWGNDDGGSLAGKVYLILGRTLVSPGTYEVSAIASHEFIGKNADDHIGNWISFAGDVNADGGEDILIGTVHSDENGSDAGAAYLVLSSSLASLGSSIPLSDADYEFLGETANDRCGEVASAGDLDADGLADILIGSYTNSDNGTLAGQAYVILGYSLGSSGSRTLAGNADYYFFGENDYDNAGWSLASGDIDGDGLSDIVIGADGYDTDKGRAYVVFSVNECEPEDVIYVDTYLGTSAGPGGSECPYDTIQAGIDAAAASGITRVIVRGGFYYEDVVLANGIELVGELRWGFWPAFIVSSGGSIYSVEGANSAAFRNFVVYEGGIHLDGVNAMTIQENIVYKQSSVYFPGLALENGASDHMIKNNIFYKHHFGGFVIAYPQYAVYIGQNSDDNQFFNNSIHSRDYTGVGIYRDVIAVYLEDYTEDNEFRNNILDTLTYPGSGGTRYGFYTAGTNVTAVIDYNKTPANNYGVSLGTGNLVLSQLPKFVNPMPYGFNYTLQAASVCVNAGDPDSLYNDPDGTQNDMGAFGGPEYLDFRS